MNSSNKPVKRKPQHQIVKEYLESGNTLTTYEAFALFKITSLNQRITDLRRKGYVIDSIPEEHDGKNYVRYYWSDENTTDDETPTEPVLTAEAPAGAYHE